MLYAHVDTDIHIPLLPVRYKFYMQISCIEYIYRGWYRVIPPVTTCPLCKAGVVPIGRGDVVGEQVMRDEPPVGHLALFAGVQLVSSPSLRLAPQHD